MQGQTPPTSTEQRHLEAVAALWCLPCAMRWWDGVLATVQHVVEGRKRLGHLFVLPGCEWHHLGTPPPPLTIDEAAANWGPSLAHQHRRFEQTFGSERQLVEITNHVLRRKSELEAHGDMLTAEMYGEWVRHETHLRLGRTVLIGR